MLKTKKCKDEKFRPPFSKVAGCRGSSLALIAAALVLSGCGTAGQTGTATPTTTVTQQQTVYTQPKIQYVKNSDTDELLNDFSYLFATGLISDAKTIKRQKYEDIITMLVSYEGELTADMWLYDAKRGMVFHEISPYSPELPCDHSEVHALSSMEKEQITAALEEADFQEWLERYPGKEGDYTSYYFGLDAEYKSGVLEHHSGCCTNKDFPGSYHSIKSLFSSFDYFENPLYVEKWGE